MIRIKIIFDKNNALLSTDTRKALLQEAIESFLEGQKVLGEEPRVKTFFIAAEIPTDPEYVEVEIALNVERSVSSEYCKSLGGEICKKIMKSSLPKFKEFEGTLFGFQIRGSNYTFWS